MQGVDPTRIRPAAMASYPAIATNDTAGRQQNRRVEMVVPSRHETGVPRVALQ